MRVSDSCDISVHAYRSVRADALFPTEALAAAAKKVKAFVSVELSMGQMIEDIRLATGCSRPVTLCNRAGGMIPDPEQVLEAIAKSAEVNE